jgi:K+-transporting ATPase ATPase B chain
MESSMLHTRVPMAALADPRIIVPAIGAAFRKLDPRVLIRNPVMFVVEVVAASPPCCSCATW